MPEKIRAYKIQPMIEAIVPLVASIRIEVEKMPDCTKKTSLLLSVVNLEKKTAIIVKEVSEEAVMQYVNKHPEVLQKLAEFAASDEGAKKIASSIVSPDDIKKDAKKKRH